MGKTRTGKKEYSTAPFVMMPWEILNSKAYKDLPPSAGKALPYFLGKPQRHFRDPMRYEAEWPFTYGEADRYGFASSTFSQIIKAVIANGFVDPVDKGGLRGNSRSSSKFRLSKRWEKYGGDDFASLCWETFQPSL